MKIWKWELNMIDRQSLMLPEGAKILTVQVQDCVACLWALCDETADEKSREIAIYGTGHPIPDGAGEYIATFQMYDGQLVFHAFEVMQ